MSVTRDTTAQSHYMNCYHLSEAMNMTLVIYIILEGLFYYKWARNNIF